MTIAELQNGFFPSGEKQVSPADFFVLLSDVTKKEKTFLLAHPEYSLDASEEKTLRDFLERRLQHEPVAYITGHKEFYGYDFSVTRDTLIPRPETEYLVENVLNNIKSGISNLEYQKKKVVVADIGTGSGNIIISIVKTLFSKSNLPADGQNSKFSFLASDISINALDIAKKNAKYHHVNSIIEFHESNLFQSIPEKFFSADEIIITANLPYLSEEIYQSSSHDVKNFEPETALVSGQAGLDHYYRLFEQVKSFSKVARSGEQKHSQITLFLEISPEQSPLLDASIPVYFSEASVKIHKDLAQKDRVVEIHIKQ